jgi:hypothetical protein
MSAAHITVRAQTALPRTVVLWERDAAHPHGEVWIVTDGAAHIVAPTSAVLERVHDGRLRRVVTATADNNAATNSSIAPSVADADTPATEAPTVASTPPKRPPAKRR